MGTHIACGSAGKSIKIWDAVIGNRLHTLTSLSDASDQVASFDAGASQQASEYVI